MSFNMVPSAINKNLPKTNAGDDIATSTASTTGDASKLVDDTTKDLPNTTKPLTDSILPGEFPEDDNPEDDDTKHDAFPAFTLSDIKTWFRSLVPKTLDRFESGVKGFVLWLVPPPRQAAIYEAAVSRPIATTFITCQLICCGVPLLVFLAGTFVFAAVAVLLWALLSCLLLGPILLVASMMGVSLWGWGWILYGLVKWVDEAFLGGLITRFWLSRMPDKEESEEEEDKRKNDEKKVG